MSALQEFIRTFVLFSVFLIVVPVCVFTADLLKNYFKNHIKNQKSRRNLK